MKNSITVKKGVFIITPYGYFCHVFGKLLATFKELKN